MNQKLWYVIPLTVIVIGSIAIFFQCVIISQILTLVFHFMPDSMAKQWIELCSSIGAILAGIAGISTCFIALIAGRAWQKKILFEHQHCALAELQSSLALWVAGFTNLFAQRNKIPISTIKPLKSTTYSDKENRYFEKLLALKDTEEESWNNMSAQSRLLKAHGFEEHVKFMAKLYYIRDDYLTALEALIELRSLEFPSLKGNRCSRLAGAYDNLKNKNKDGDFVWISEKVFPHWDDVADIKSPLVRSLKHFW